jgi:hypothetical protein
MTATKALYGQGWAQSRVPLYAVRPSRTWQNSFLRQANNDVFNQAEFPGFTMKAPGKHHGNFPGFIMT